MIFVTVGTQMPFDRLVKEVDAWAGARQKEVFAQIGPSNLELLHIKTIPNLDPQEFDAKMQEATAVVSHAGVGTILTAFRLSKPIIVMPRLAMFKEHRNDHQLATVRQLKGRPGILIAMDEAELRAQLDALETMPVVDGISERASIQLIDGIRAFINK